MGDDGARLSQAEWLLLEANKTLDRARATQKEQETGLDGVKALQSQQNDLMARVRGVLGATTNEDYFLRLNVLIHQHNEYYAMLVGKAVAETMHRAYTITMNPN